MKYFVRFMENDLKWVEILLYVTSLLSDKQILTEHVHYYSPIYWYSQINYTAWRNIPSILHLPITIAGGLNSLSIIN